ncbi:hypothetical protein MNBD_GAMMA12-3506 [hydrothermal vent metagenome]|uniref:Globin family profile domain-containing protein n=1 Tax=hydrothermal vent metagenome TaxID=652676 RepID=A0A3B0Y0R8_9ZZZZ
MNEVLPPVQLSSKDVKEIQISFGRCLVSVNNELSFLELFYRLFISSHSDIKAMFVNTDLKKQYKLLHVGLNMALLFIDGNHSISLNVLEKIRKTHSRNELNIKPELYVFWIDSLIETIKIKDEQFNNELENKWRIALQKAVDFIVDGY